MKLSFPVGPMMSLAFADKKSNLYAIAQQQYPERQTLGLFALFFYYITSRRECHNHSFKKHLQLFHGFSAFF